MKILGSISHIWNRFCQFVGLKKADPTKQKLGALNQEEKYNLHKPVEVTQYSWLGKIRASLFQKLFPIRFAEKLFELFVIDTHAHPFDIKHFANYSTKPISIDLGGQHLSDKYYIHPKNNSSPKLCYVITHGARSSARTIGGGAKAIVDAGHSVVVGDNLGFGANKETTLTRERLFDDIRETILKASDISKCEELRLLSHSMGTALQVKALVQIFRKEQENGKYDLKVGDLTLVSSWDRMENILHDLDDKKKWAEFYQSIKDPDLKNQLTSFKDLAGQDTSTGIFKGLDNVLGSSWNIIDNLKELIELNAKRPEAYRLKSLSILHGDDDRIIRPERALKLAKLVTGLPQKNKPNLRFVLIKNAGHFDMLRMENSTQTLRYLLHALSSRPKKSVEYLDINLKDGSKMHFHKLNPNNLSDSKHIKQAA